MNQPGGSRRAHGWLGAPRRRPPSRGSVGTPPPPAHHQGPFAGDGRTLTVDALPLFRRQQPRAVGVLPRAQRRAAHARAGPLVDSAGRDPDQSRVKCRRRDEGKLSPRPCPRPDQRLRLEGLPHRAGRSRMGRHPHGSARYAPRPLPAQPRPGQHVRRAEGVGWAWGDAGDDRGSASVAGLLTISPAGKSLTQGRSSSRLVPKPYLWPDWLRRGATSPVEHPCSRRVGEKR